MIPSKKRVTMRFVLVLGKEAAQYGRDHKADLRLGPEDSLQAVSFLAAGKTLVAEANSETIHALLSAVAGIASLIRIVLVCEDPPGCIEALKEVSPGTTKDWGARPLVTEVVLAGASAEEEQLAAELCGAARDAMVSNMIE